MRTPLVLARVALISMALFLSACVGSDNATLLAGSTVAPTESSNSPWVTVWSWAPMGLVTANFLNTGRIPGQPLPVPVVLNDTTLRMVIKPTAGGEVFRLKLSNIFGDSAPVVEQVHVGIHAGNGEVKAGTNRLVTFNQGQQALSMAQNDYLSDQFNLQVSFGEELAVTLFLKGPHLGTLTGHLETNQEAYIAPGSTAELASAESSSQFPLRWVSSAYLSELQVQNSDQRGVLVVVGDSITDGTGSEINSNSRWSDVLAKRLATAEEPVAVQSIANMGIGANRLLSDPYFPLTALFNSGPGLLNRMDRDVLGVNRVSHVIVLIGTNDIGIPPGTTAAELIAGYRQLLGRLKTRGIKAYIATLLPSGIRQLPFRAPLIHFSAEAKALRDEVNQWIRTQNEFDAVIDFAKCVEDPDRPGFMRAEYDSGDGLHPNSTGYKAMGDFIPLELLR